jgi:activator of 2-hydroxyglutaryl-CoA dehydratase/predicted nucleotide-binding protein (sugar kinase/HSP70/actin superfamily)
MTDKAQPGSHPHGEIRFLAGVDVGSTTVKAVVAAADGGEILWRDYRRHDTRQAEMLHEFLQRMESEIGISPGNCRIFITGSGGSALAAPIGACFVQEVNAVALAVEKMHPEAQSVIELGGQDAKIILFKTESGTGRRRKSASMNDKCAGGTGAVIDKIQAKLKISADELPRLAYRGVRIHPVAGKCGVFAETDINGLQKQGVPPAELMASLFDAIVLQNLTVLSRGHTLLPHVLLLGGPNAFLRGLREAWQHNIPLLWKERGIELPAGQTAEDLIQVPPDALYFAALGAVEFGRGETEEKGLYLGCAALERFLDAKREQRKIANGKPGLCASIEELQAFKDRYTPAQFIPAAFERGEQVEAFIGLDSGSTSTKAVLLSPSGEVLAKAYRLSEGNPITDAIEVLGDLRRQVEEDSGASLKTLGIATTGYAKDILQQVLNADAALVETVAHTESALRYVADPHVVVDVGGQDIKLILLRQGRVRDFKLNAQCSAGNGYFLQSTAEGFGIPVERYAETAFAAQAMPTFGYGCAVFLQSDIVNFQRQGWQAGEILAGLATVLPRNVFLHVAKAPDLTALGSRFVLQGGTQNNLAAVKAEVDFLRAGFRSTGIEPEIVVHPHCGEAGAIGAGLEAQRLWRKGRVTSFIGMDAVSHIRYTTTCNEETRCRFCKNACLRTLLDVEIADATGREADSAKAGSRRIILAGCEKGAVDDLETMRGIQAHEKAIRAASPNLVERAAREVWLARHPESVAEPLPAHAWSAAERSRVALARGRSLMRIGIPRVLNMYAYAPLFSGYLESLGVRAENIIYSDVTNGEMYRAGSSRGSIDPCFPSKIAIAHFHNLLFKQHERTPLNAIFFPMFDVLATPLVNTKASNGCPTASVTPETVEAAFTKETALIAERGIRYVHPLLNLSHRKLFARQMGQAWGPMLGLRQEENDRAVEIGFRELERYESGIRREARKVLDQLEAEDRLGIVMLGRPYHHDPGINHGIMAQFQMLGYPIFSQSTLPMDEDLLDRLFGEEIRAGVIDHALDISDVWKTTFSASSNHKLWAAKFTARHPNLVAVEFSSFKCGHDAPIYHAIEQIIERSGTPFFSFKDMDENCPAHSIRLRVETIDYFLKRYQEVRLHCSQRDLATEQYRISGNAADRNRVPEAGATTAT